MEILFAFWINKTLINFNVKIFSAPPGIEVRLVGTLPSISLLPHIPLRSREFTCQVSSAKESVVRISPFKVILFLKVLVHPP